MLVAEGEDSHTIVLLILIAIPVALLFLAWIGMGLENMIRNVPELMRKPGPPLLLMGGVFAIVSLVAYGLGASTAAACGWGAAGAAAVLALMLFGS